MQYYMFELDEASKNICGICTPHDGNFHYCHLGMDINQSPDIAQEIMEKIFRGIAEVDVYLDDIGAFDFSWSDHLKTL